MAGSGLPPLPNIPYCCLPQESGPCLSTSVGDRPLRSPSHRRLGGPSPRQPANGTHARPPPRLRFARREMPPRGTMPYYPAFPPAIRLRGAGCIRVTHPSATLGPPKGALPSDLHVLGLPLAFILSQDQTLRCIIALLCLYSESGFRLRFLFRFLVRPPTAPPDAHVGSLCAGLKLSKNLRKLPSVFPALPSVVCGCKSTTFWITYNTFQIIFLLFISTI